MLINNEIVGYTFLANRNLKIFYLNNLMLDNDYNVFDNLGFGVQCRIKKYKVNFGLQMLTSGVINIGTSLSGSIK